MRARLRRARPAIVALSLACVASVASAQAVRTTTPRAPADELDDAFTRITSVRELPDGRLLVADGGEDMRLALVDWRAGTVRTLGREGDGPGEYRSIGRLVALGGDSTLLEDMRSNRWLVLAGDRFVTTERIPLSRGGTPLVAGGDRQGRVLRLDAVSFGLQAGMSRPVPYIAFADTVAVVRAVRTSSAGDTIARIAGPWRPTRSVRKPVQPGAAPIQWTVVNPLATYDQALMFEDGWIALVLADPYRVEWRAPDGRWVRGRALPLARVPVDAQQKRAAMDRDYDPSVGMKEDELPPWPAVLPAFLVDRIGVLADPAGRVVIRRTPDATRPGTFYDVVDRAGALVGRVALDADEHLVGFGRRSAYVVHTDDDGLQWLRRHPWP